MALKNVGIEEGCTTCGLYEDTSLFQYLLP